MNRTFHDTMQSAHFLGVAAKFKAEADIANEHVCNATVKAFPEGALIEVEINGKKVRGKVSGVRPFTPDGSGAGDVWVINEDTGARRKFNAIACAKSVKFLY